MIIEVAPLFLPRRNWSFDSGKNNGVVPRTLSAQCGQERGWTMIYGKYKYLRLVLMVLIVILLEGCATLPISVKRNVVFYLDRQEKIPIKIGLFLSNEEKNYTIRVRAFEYKIGEALEEEATGSLRKVFLTVSVFNSKDKLLPDIDRIIAIKFGTETGTSSYETVEFKLFGGSTFQHTSKVELICEVYDRNWNLLWKVTALGTGGPVKSFLRPFATPSEVGHHGVKENKDIIIHSLVLALEKLNDKILTSGKETILKGK